MHLKVLSARWSSVCLGLNVLMTEGAIATAAMVLAFSLSFVTASMCYQWMMPNNIQIQFSGDFVIMIVPLAINPYAIVATFILSTKQLSKSMVTTTAQSKLVSASFNWICQIEYMDWVLHFWYNMTIMVPHINGDLNICSTSFQANNKKYSSIVLAVWKRKPLITGRFPSQRTNNLETISMS